MRVTSKSINFLIDWTILTFAMLMGFVLVMVYLNITSYSYVKLDDSLSHAPVTGLDYLEYKENNNDLEIIDYDVSMQEVEERLARYRRMAWLAFFCLLGLVCCHGRARDNLVFFWKTIKKASID